MGIQNGKIESAYGLYINIDEKAEEAIINSLMKPANKKVEVLVRHLKTEKEFTFADFFERLGFYD